MTGRSLFKVGPLVLFFVFFFIGCLSSPEPEITELPETVTMETQAPAEPEKIMPKFIDHYVNTGEDPGKIVDIYYGTSFSVIRFAVTNVPQCST